MSAADRPRRSDKTVVKSLNEHKMAVESRERPVQAKDPVEKSKPTKKPAKKPSKKPVTKPAKKPTKKPTKKTAKYSTRKKPTAKATAEKDILKTTKSGRVVKPTSTKPKANIKTKLDNPPTPLQDKSGGNSQSKDTSVIICSFFDNSDSDTAGKSDTAKPKDLGAKKSRGKSASKTLQTKNDNASNGRSSVTKGRNGSLIKKQPDFDEISDSDEASTVSKSDNFSSDRGTHKSYTKSSKPRYPSAKKMEGEPLPKKWK